MKSLKKQRDGLLQLTIGAAFTRGLRLVCPACGEGRLFSGWFRMHKVCNECGFVYDRAPGYFLGSTYINYGATTVLSTVSYVILHFGLRAPETLVIVAIATFCVIFPLVFFRFARSLWLSMDCFLDRTGALEATGDGANSQESLTSAEIES